MMRAELEHIQERLDKVMNAHARQKQPIPQARKRERIQTKEEIDDYYRDEYE